MPSDRVAEFSMHGARDAMAAGLTHIEAQVSAIEAAVIENPGLAFDLAKTLVESVCRSILTQRHVNFDKGDDVPRLLREVTNCLPLLPAEASGEAGARRSLAQTLSGLQTTLMGICELRNAYGFSSHGSAEGRAEMESVQALLAAEAADAIVGFLHRVHCGERPAVEKRLEYYDNPEFNEYIDESNGPVFIFNLEYSPSDVLFNVDQEAYRDQLAAFEAESAIQQEEEQLLELHEEKARTAS